VPQGLEHQTLAIGIKEMLVSGGGGEVAVFHINFCLPSKVDNFSLVTSLKLAIFKASERSRSQVNFYIDKRFPPKDFENFIRKYDMKRACVRTNLYHKVESSKLSL